MALITYENSSVWVGGIFVAAIIGVSALIFASTLDDNDPLKDAIAAGWSPQQIKCVFKNTGGELERVHICSGLELPQSAN